MPDNEKTPVNKQTPVNNGQQGETCRLTEGVEGRGTAGVQGQGSKPQVFLPPQGQSKLGKPPQTPPSDQSKKSE